MFFKLLLYYEKFILFIILFLVIRIRLKNIGEFILFMIIVILLVSVSLLFINELYNKRNFKIDKKFKICMVLKLFYFINIWEGED